MGFIVMLIIFVGGGLLLGARSRISRLEYRLRLVEEELRRRIAAGREVLAEPVRHEAPVAVQAPPVAVAAAPQPAADIPEPEPAAEIAAESEPLAEPAPEPEPSSEEQPLPAPEPPRAAAWAIPASRITAPVKDPQETASDDREEAPASAAAVQEPEPQPAAPIRRMSVNFEELFGRKLPIWAGGITLAIAGVLIVKYAIDQGIFARIFTPGVQAVCGMLFAFGLIGGAEWARHAREKVADPRVSQALSGAGISTLYAALLVAANLYHLISPLTAFIGLAMVTGGALWLSLRHGMPSALLGLAGGLAAPAMTVGLDANVPMLAGYLGFTIAGLAGVARVQRWPWLALLALLGGAGWSLWLILAGKALDTVGALSIGGFVVLLALVLPLFVFTDAAQRLLRAIAAIVGAAQLGLLVALGGFQPLHWGLFVLIAAAGQFLAWRERSLTIVPTIGAALSFLLLLIWPGPSGGWLLTIGLALAAIHAGPLLARLWNSPVRLQRAIELCGIALAAPLLALRHMDHEWSAIDPPVALCALGGALLVLGGAALGWKNPERSEDNRFVLLLATGGLLLSAAAWFGLAHWQAPLWTMAVALGLLVLAPRSMDRRVELLAAAFGALSLLQLASTLVPGRLDEVAVLVGWSGATTDLASLLRWAALAIGFGLFAWKAERGTIRMAAYPLCAALAYGATAQLLPDWPLPMAMAAIAAALLLVLGKREGAWSETLVLPFFAAAVVLLGLTGQHPLGEWIRLVDAGDAPASLLAALRWVSVGAFGLLLAARARLTLLRFLGRVGAIGFAYGALAQLVPGWTLPIALAAVTALALETTRRHLDAQHEGLPFAYGLGALGLLAITGPDPLGEWLRLGDAGSAGASVPALLRWAAVAALGVHFTLRSRLQHLRSAGEFAAIALAYGAMAQVVPGWTLPIALSLVAAAGLYFLGRRADALSEWQMTLFGAAAVGLLAISGTDPRGEWLRLIGEGDGLLSAAALARWGIVALLGGFYALRSRLGAVRLPGEVSAALLGYGALAQVVPQLALPLVPPLALLGAAWWSRSRPWPALSAASTVLILLSLAWAFLPLANWFDLALRSLGGMPMLLDRPDLTATVIARRLALPALLIGIATWLQRERLPRRLRIALSGLAGLLALVSFHAVYRHLFAAAFGSDFTATGLGQRMLWASLLLALGWLVWKRLPQSNAARTGAALLAATAVFHTLWYSLLLHNPLWTAQHVGPLPAVNLLAPLFALLPLSLRLLARIREELAGPIARVMQPLLMLCVIGFAWATLRQAFHGTLLVEPGVSDLEDIFRSILGIALAIGFLLWGIGRKRHDWRIASLVLMLGAVAKVFLFDASGLEGLLRIASFVALGFSLIGIGWLYSRQLRRDQG